MGRLFKLYNQSIQRDGPQFDFSLVEAAHPSERETFIDDLLANLDAWSALALARLKAERAVPILARTLQKTGDPYYARALWLITGDNRYIESIIIPLRNRERTDGLEWIRLAGLLDGIVIDEAFEVLAEAFLDDDYLVRHNAAAIYIRNTGHRPDDRTLQRNLLEFDENRIRRFLDRIERKREQ